MTAFATLNLDDRLLKALAALGLQTPTPVQLAAVPPALAGHDLLVSAATGSGKTVAYLLPALARLLADRTVGGPRALVLVPTRELARQVYKQCEKLAEFTHLRAALVTGGEDFKYQAARLRRNPELVIATPGRLLEHAQQGGADLSRVELLILDEADRMLDMGFSPDVLDLAGRCASVRQSLLLSATLNHRELAGITTKLLRDPETIAVDAARAAPAQIRQQLVLSDGDPHKRQLLLWLLANETAAKVLVFTNTRARADQLGRFLQQQELAAGVLHGEVDQNARRQTINRLREGRIRILLATDLAARGLDIEGVELVINFDMPRSGDDYNHRIGRTGRAGAEGLAITLIDAQEWNLMASVERYLGVHFERRRIPGLAGHYRGPKKLKTSGKAVGNKKKKDDKKTAKAAKPARPKKKPAAPSQQPAPYSAQQEAGFKPLTKPRGKRS